MNTETKGNWLSRFVAGMRVDTTRVQSPRLIRSNASDIPAPKKIAKPRNVKSTPSRPGSAGRRIK